jgi:uncharacterized protein with GYD domain
MAGRFRIFAVIRWSILFKTRHIRRLSMPKYLIQGSYTSEGTKGVRKDGGSKRRQVAESLMKEAGGKLDSFYFTFGDTDFLGIADIPDNITAAALSLAVNASGLATVRTTPLLTVEEMDSAAKKQIGYRGPGQ